MFAFKSSVALQNELLRRQGQKGKWLLKKCVTFRFEGSMCLQIYNEYYMITIDLKAN